MLNQITVMGRLTADPVLRQTQSDKPVSVCSFRIACERDVGKKDDKISDFFDCVAWRSNAEFTKQYFTKGRTAVVRGRLENKQWTDKEGIKRYGDEIQVENIYFGDSPKQKDESASIQAAEQPGGVPQADAFAPPSTSPPPGFNPFV